MESTLQPQWHPWPRLHPRSPRRETCGRRESRDAKHRARTQPAARVQAELSEAEAAAIVEVVKRLDERCPPIRLGLPRRRNALYLSAEPKRSARRPNTRKPERSDCRQGREAAIRSRAGRRRQTCCAIQKSKPAVTAKSVRSLHPRNRHRPNPHDRDHSGRCRSRLRHPSRSPTPVREPEKKLVVQRAKLPVAQHRENDLASRHRSAYRYREADGCRRGSAPERRRRHRPPRRRIHQTRQRPSSTTTASKSATTSAADPPHHTAKPNKETQ